MAGDSPSTPPPSGADTTGATELDALRARLAAAELGLSQTQTALSSARLTIAENDAAAAAAPPSAVDAARPPTGVGGGGGAAPDVGTAAPDATVGRTGEGGAAPGVAAAGGGDVIPPARDGADVGGVPAFGADAYVAAVDDDAYGEDDATDWGGGPRGRHAGARRGGRFPSRADALDEAGFLPLLALSIFISLPTTAYSLVLWLIAQSFSPPPTPVSVNPFSTTSIL